jgi:cytochrome o ubiquinol oxidase operon protein cyoD
MSILGIVISGHENNRTTLRTYVTGYSLSIVLTVAAYLMVTHHTFSKWALAITIGTLALTQFMVQLIFFLHLGQDTKPRFKIGVFLFMLLVVFILIVGSIWIMHSLNYRMNLSPQRITQYMNAQVGI